MRLLRSLSPLLFLLPGLALLWSQASVSDGKTISEIRIELDGPKTLGNSFILQNLQIETGIPFVGSAIDKSIANLMATGAIDDVKVFIDPESSTDEQVVLVFKVRTKPRIGEIKFSGNDELSNRKLEKEIEISVGELFDEAEIKADQIALEELYLEKGFWNSRIESEVKQMSDNKNVSIVFRIVENEKRKIRKISFEGNENLSARKLLKEMETAPWRFWRFWSKRSRYRPSVLEEDLNQLRAAYRDEGFLDVKIEQSGVSISPEGNSGLGLTIKVVEGERSYFGETVLAGNVVITTDELLADGRIKRGEPYSPTLLSEERERLRKKYGEKGYLDARVRSIRKPNLDTDQIDLRFEITENNKFSVNSIQVRGNEKTKTVAIIRELALAPGETFDLIRMETSEARLRNTRFFEKVTFFFYRPFHFRNHVPLVFLYIPKIVYQKVFLQFV